MLAVRLIVVAAGLSVAGCTLPASAPSATDAASLSSSLQICADEINRYRASIGRPTLSRSESLERFASEAAQHDANAGVPHLLFKLTNGGGVSLAETELLRWTNREVHDVIRQGLASMWASGPAGEHYAVLAGPYTQVGCGVYVNGNEVSVAQDYR